MLIGSLISAYIVTQIPNPREGLEDLSTPRGEEKARRRLAATQRR